MDKPLVKLPRAVSDDIKQLKREGASEYSIFKIACGEIEGKGINLKKWAEYVSADDWVNGNTDARLILLMNALVNDYEIEQTPEERAIQWLIKKNAIHGYHSEHDIVMGIKSILEGGGTE